MDQPPSDRFLDSIGPETRTMWYETTTTTPPPTTTGLQTESNTEIKDVYTDWYTTTGYWQTTRGYYWYCTGRWIDQYDYYDCRDSCDGGYYYLEGIFGTFFALLASIIAWCGSCKRQSEPFSILYRVQATFAVLGMLTTMGALGWDIYLMIEYGYELNRYCTDIFGIWLAEIVIVFIVLINTMVSSGRLGCCCVVGCPSNSINPMNPVAESIEERPVQNGAFAVDNRSIQSGESQA